VITVTACNSIELLSGHLEIESRGQPSIVSLI
jgi:hypothetical protein